VAGEPIGSASHREVIARDALAEIQGSAIGMVTLTTVQLTDDLRHARVFFSCVGDAAARDRSLNGCAVPVASSVPTDARSLRVHESLPCSTTLENAERLAKLSMTRIARTMRLPPYK